MGYPLAPLLRVREFREEAAKNAVRAAERAVAEAEAETERRRAELARYAVWREEEAERRYAAIMGASLSLKEVDEFKAGLGALADGELQRREAVDRAEEEAGRRREALSQARDAARRAQHETAKILAHRDIWREEARREAERLEDVEMEEFRTLPPQGTEED